MPVDTSTFQGYCVIFIFQISLSLAYVIIVTIFVSLFFGWGLFFYAFRMHFQSMFQNMDDLMHRDTAPGSTINVKACLAGAVQLHIEAQE